MEKSIGIGCYHFGVKKSPPFAFTGKDYIDKLNTALSKIASLNNLKINTDDDFRNYKQDVMDELPNLEYDEGFFPNPIFLDIQFELYIPFRIQAELIERNEKFLDTYSEKFKVYIVQSYFLPVAIIEIVDPTKQPDPSTGVVIVREFLRKNFERTNGVYI